MVYPRRSTGKDNIKREINLYHSLTSPTTNRRLFIDLYFCCLESLLNIYQETWLRLATWKPVLSDHFQRSIPTSFSSSYPSFELHLQHQISQPMTSWKQAPFQTPNTSTSSTNDRRNFEPRKVSRTVNHSGPKYQPAYPSHLACFNYWNELTRTRLPHERSSHQDQSRNFLSAPPKCHQCSSPTQTKRVIWWFLWGDPTKCWMVGTFGSFRNELDGELVRTVQQTWSGCL